MESQLHSKMDYFISENIEKDNCQKYGMLLSILLTFHKFKWQILIKIATQDNNADEKTQNANYKIIGKILKMDNFYKNSI